MDPKDQDHEAKLFLGAPEHVQKLFKEAKRVRRVADRKLWWSANKPPIKPEEEQPGGMAG